MRRSRPAVRAFRSPSSSVTCETRRPPLASFAFAAWLALSAAAACYERTTSRFPHQLHLTQIPCGDANHPACLSCSSCHEGRHHSEPRGTPESTACSGCHQGDAGARLARVRQRAPATSPAATDVRFSHARHLALPEIRGQCMRCHAGTVEDTSTAFPPMAQCLSCHEHERQFDRGQCNPCHEPRDLRRLVPTSFMTHDESWIRRHGEQARRREVVCTTCHEQSDCTDCHDTSQGLAIELRRPEAIESGFVHRGDFLTRHAMEAAAAPARCLNCHVPATCDACHVERGVSGNATGGRSPHPIGWMGDDPASPSFHGRAARRDLLACAGCHDQGPRTNCIRCHRVGGYGGSPHPGGFRSNRSPTSSSCRYCHVP